MLGGEPLREKFTQKPGKCERFVVVESCQNCPRLGPSRARVADSPIDVSAAVPPIMGVPKWKSSCPPAHYCQVANQQDFTEGAKGDIFMD